MVKLGVNWDYLSDDHSGAGYKRDVRTLKRLGFNGLMVTGFQEKFMRSNLAEIKDVIASEGLAVYQVHCSATPNLGHFEPTERENGVECYKRWIGYALELGSEIMVVHPMGWRDLFDEEERKTVRDRNLAAVRELVKEVRKTKLKIALENLPVSCVMRKEHGQGYGFHMEELTELVDGLNRRNAGICLDMGHAFGAGLNVREAILVSKGYLVATHFTDYRDIYENQHLLPGDGNIDWKIVADTLREIKYNGPWVLEVSPWDLKKNRMAREWKRKVELLERTRDYIKSLV